VTEQKTDAVNAEPTCLGDFLATLSEADRASRVYMVVWTERGKLLNWQVQGVGNVGAFTEMARVATQFATDCTVAETERPEGRAH